MIGKLPKKFGNAKSKSASRKNLRGFCLPYIPDFMKKLLVSDSETFFSQTISSVISFVNKPSLFMTEVFPFARSAWEHMP